MAHVWQAREDIVPGHHFLQGQNCFELFPSPLHPKLPFSLSWVQQFVQLPGKHIYEMIWSFPLQTVVSAQRGNQEASLETETSSQGMQEHFKLDSLLNRVHYRNKCWRTLYLFMHGGSHQPQPNRQETHINGLFVAGAIEGCMGAFRLSKSMSGYGRSSYFTAA